MQVTVQIPRVLRTCCDDQAELAVTAATVRAALVDIERRYPQLYRSVCDETGAVRRHVHLFVNTSLVAGAAALEQPLAVGDVVSIFPAVSGG